MTYREPGLEKVEPSAPPSLLTKEKKLILFLTLWHGGLIGLAVLVGRWSTGCVLLGTYVTNLWLLYLRRKLQT